MAKGSYGVNEEGRSAPAVRDVSYKSCLCALLIFLVFCLIIIFVGIKFSKKGEVPVDEKISKENIGLVGGAKSTTTEGPVIKTTRYKKPVPPPITKPHTTTPKVTSQATTPKTTTKTVVVIPVTSEHTTTIEPEPNKSTVATPTPSTGNVTTVETTLSTNISVTPIIIATNTTTSTTIIDTTPLTTKPTAPPVTPALITTTQITTTVDDWTSNNYWNETSVETDFSPLSKKSLPICNTPACKSTGSRLLSLMDFSSDPCEDFYQFSCGGMKSEVLETDTWRRILSQMYLIDNTSPEFLIKYRTFYDSCVLHEYEFNYETRVATVLKLVKEVGEITFNNDETKTFDLTKLFANLIWRQSLRIMDVDVDIDAESKKFEIKLGLPRKMSLLKETGAWSDLSDDQRRCLVEQKTELQAEKIDLTKVHDVYLECQKNRAIYLNSIETVVRSLGFLTGDEFSQTQQIQDLRTTIEWSILDCLNELPPPNEQRKTTLYKKYNPETVGKLQANYALLQWKDLLTMLIGRPVEDTTPIQLYFPAYFTKLFKELQKLEKWKVNNALIAMYAQDLYENLVIPQAKHNREDYCIRLATKLFPDLSSHLYMKTYAQAEVTETQNFLTEMFKKLKEKLKESFDKADWLDEGSQRLLTSKLTQKIALVFNKPDDVYNDISSLQLRYKGLMLNESNFMDNAVNTLQLSKRLLLEFQGELYSTKFLWGNFINAYDRTPKSFYTKGLIVFPMGVVGTPIRQEFPGYLKMSQLGLSLARELARHFDLVGIQRGMPMSPAFKRALRNFKKIMEDKATLTGTRIHENHKVIFAGDPKLSANERIVDNTAVRLITDSFNSFGEESVLPWASTAYSKEKIFFITIAQGYCKNIDMPEYMEHLFESEILPPALRVENIVINSEAFEKVFECPDGSAMNNNPHYKLQFPYLQKPEDSDESDDEDDSDDYLSKNIL